MLERFPFSSPTGRIAPLKRLVTLLAPFLLVACMEEEELGYVERPVDQLYNGAMDTLDQRFYNDAALMFDEVERQHPYSTWATKAQLMAAYSLYLDNNYDEAIFALDRFIQLHPSNHDVPYAHYLKALSYYEQISDVTRDQRMTELALKTFNEIIARYPKRKYARDAKIKLDLTNGNLAGKEMEIGRYYLKQRHYLAAINRFKTVVDNYQTTIHVPEALHRLTEAYLALGIKEEAQKTAAVLGHNFPGSEWYIDSYEMVEKKQIRPKEKAPWYKLGTPGQPLQEEPTQPKDKEAWYKLW
jgi:outer membrane protein assembly factor BamD